MKAKIDYNKLNDIQPEQIISKSGGKSDSPDFPVFNTKLSTTFFVYIPTNFDRVVPSEQEGVPDSVIFDPLKTYTHPCKKGNGYPVYRCINGLDMPQFPELGYTGVCPLCEATKYAWEKYNILYEKEAKKANYASVDSIPKDDKAMAAIRSTLLGDMVVKSPNCIYTFPIVVLNEVGMPPVLKTEDDFTKVCEEAVPMFFQINSQGDPWTKFSNQILNGFGADKKLSGRFLKIDFKYTPKDNGKVNLRDAGKNVTYTWFVGELPPEMTKLAEYCETLVREKNFTKASAQEHIYSLQLWTREDLEKEAEEITVSTRAFVESNKAMGEALENNASQLTTGASPTASIEDKLNSFSLPQGDLNGAVASGKIEV